MGRRERDVAWDITRLYHEEGADEPAFESIVGSGPTGARPHGRAGDRVIEAGELVVIDTGANVGGYVSDYTRTLATGELDGEMREAYDVVLAAQQAGLDAIRAGVRGIDADAAARGVIEGSDFAGTFGHGLGHGLGLDVHESPRLSTESSDTLATGNVVTVEPGVYLEGRFGDPDRGRRGRDRRRDREPRAVHEGAAHRRLATIVRRGRDGRHEQLQERDAHRARRQGVADRRVPARQARQGRRVRPHEAEEPGGGRGRRPHVPRRARSSRACTPRRRTSSTSTTTARTCISWTRRRTSSSPCRAPTSTDELPFMQPNATVQVLAREREAVERAAAGVGGARPSSRPSRA